MRLPLAGRIALVAGATRGAGRGIALALGEAGATVYCTGRSSRANRPAPGDARAGATATPTTHGDDDDNDDGASGRSPFDLDARPETVEETAELVTARGGRGVAVIADHTDEAQVRALAKRVGDEHARLDVLVNDIWGCEALIDWGTPAWRLDLAAGRAVLDRAVWSHVVTLRHLTPLLFESDGGLVVEITDGDHLYYRGQLFYDLAKLSVIRLAFALAEELRDYKITALALTPGFLRSEAMLEHLGVGEANWRDAVAADPHFVHSETPRYVGRAVAALAADHDRRRFHGRLTSSWELARAYGFADADGARPDWGVHADAEDFGRDQRASHERFATMGRRDEPEK